MMLTKGLYPHIHRCRVRIPRSSKDPTLCPRLSQNGARRDNLLEDMEPGHTRRREIVQNSDDTRRTRRYV